MEKEVFHPTESGSPQGGVISPVIANQALDGLESLLQQRFPSKTRKMIHLIRYADDFVVTATSKETLQKEVMPVFSLFSKHAVSPSRWKRRLSPILKIGSTSWVRMCANTTANSLSSPRPRANERFFRKFEELSRRKVDLYQPMVCS